MKVLAWLTGRANQTGLSALKGIIARDLEYSERALRCAKRDVDFYERRVRQLREAVNLTEAIEADAAEIARAALPHP